MFGPEELETFITLRDAGFARDPDVTNKLAQFDTSREQARKALAGLDAHLADGTALPANVASVVRQKFFNTLLLTA